VPKIITKFTKNRVRTRAREKNNQAGRKSLGKYIKNIRTKLPYRGTPVRGYCIRGLGVVPNKVVGEAPEYEVETARLRRRREEVRKILLL